MITKNLSTLEINNLSAKQYSREKLADNLKDSALYLVPETSFMPSITGMVQTKDLEGESCTIIQVDTALRDLALDTSEHLVYIPLAKNLILNGQRVFLGKWYAPDKMPIENELVELKFFTGETTTPLSLEYFKDGRGWSTNQTLNLLVRGTGRENEFEYAVVLNLPYPSAENVSF